MSGLADASWITGEDGISYPPEPWCLGGIFHASVWLIPRSDLPVALLKGTRPIALGSRALVITGWGVYTPGGVLSYNEMMCMVAVRVKLCPVVTITHIWVDSAASAAGGRELWGIPKKIGTFHSDTGEIFNADVSDHDGPIASFRFAPGLALPGWWRIPMQTAQILHGRLKLTSFQALGRPRFGRGTWKCDDTGPLRFLNGCKPLFSVRLDQMALSCGVLRQEMNGIDKF